MKAQLRKTIVLPISLDDRPIQEVIINVDWNILDKVERVYATSAEYVAAQILPNIIHVQRNKISQILCLWCQGKTELKQVEISEAVMTADQATLYRYIGMIQAAILWSIRGPDGLPLITDANFEKLINGEDLDEEPPKIQDEVKAEVKSPKKKTGATSKKPTA